MQAFRLSREKYALPLSGLGASLNGARWNSIGVELIYAASNRSLAMAEVAVHFTYATLPDDFVMITIDIPDSLTIQTIEIDQLPENWNKFPHPLSTQEIGNQFFRQNKFCILRVPSVVTQGDYNILINPYRTDFNKIKVVTVEPFPFDRRIFT